MIAKGRYKDRIRIERPTADDSFDGAGSGVWEKVASVWAEFQDARPGRAERLDNGIVSTPRMARVIMPYRTDITSAMRVVLVEGGKDVRIAQLVSEPATLGRRDAIEFVVQDYSPDGNAA